MITLEASLLTVSVSPSALDAVLEVPRTEGIDCDSASATPVSLTSFRIEVDNSPISPFWPGLLAGRGTLPDP